MKKGEEKLKEKEEEKPVLVLMEFIIDCEHTGFNQIITRKYKIQLQ